MDTDEYLPSGHGAGEYAAQFPSTWRSLHPLRRGLGDWLRDILPEPGPRFELVLVGSELFATAVRAHGGHADLIVTVAAWTDGPAVVIEVRWRHGAGSDATARGGIQGDEASRALAVVAAVVEVLRVRARDGVLHAEKQAAPSGERFRALSRG
jgi:hypothetical protein